MIKGIALLKRKPGLSPEEFRRHYEEVHAPLIRRLIPSIRGYTRNYVTSSPFPGPSGGDFDCITEQWFDDARGFQEMIDAMAGEAGHAIRSDERTFLDRARTVYLMVEETQTAP